MKALALSICILLLCFSSIAGAEDRIKLKTTRIIGNKELPGILYIVPWSDAKHTKSSEQKLVLHSLFGDLFEPVTPKYGTISSTVTQQTTQP
jgi:hypothetical protein